MRLTNHLLAGMILQVFRMPKKEDFLHEKHRQELEKAHAKQKKVPKFRCLRLSFIFMGLGTINLLQHMEAPQNKCGVKVVPVF